MQIEHNSKNKQNKSNKNRWARYIRSHNIEQFHKELENLKQNENIDREWLETVAPLVLKTTINTLMGPGDQRLTVLETISDLVRFAGPDWRNSEEESLFETINNAVIETSVSRFENSKTDQENWLDGVVANWLDSIYIDRYYTDKMTDYLFSLFDAEFAKSVDSILNKEDAITQKTFYPLILKIQSNIQNNNLNASFLNNLTALEFTQYADDLLLSALAQDDKNLICAVFNRTRNPDELPSSLKLQLIHYTDYFNRNNITAEAL